MPTARISHQRLQGAPRQPVVSKWSDVKAPKKAATPTVDGRDDRAAVVTVVRWEGKAIGVNEQPKGPAR